MNVRDRVIEGIDGIRTRRQFVERAVRGIYDHAIGESDETSARLGVDAGDRERCGFPWVRIGIVCEQNGGEICQGCVFDDCQCVALRERGIVLANDSDDDTRIRRRAVRVLDRVSERVVCALADCKIANVRSVGDDIPRKELPGRADAGDGKGRNIAHVDIAVIRQQPGCDHDSAVMFVDGQRVLDRSWWGIFSRDKNCHPRGSGPAVAIVDGVAEGISRRCAEREGLKLTVGIVIEGAVTAVNDCSESAKQI